MKKLHSVLMSTLLFGALSAFSSEASGQTDAVVPATEACAYEHCGLWVDYDRWGATIVRGAEADHVARLGSFRVPDLQSIVSRSDSAVNQAALFERYQRSAGVGRTLGFGLLVGGLIAAAADHPWTAVAMNVSAAGVTLWTVGHATRSARALNKALWWYNASLDATE